MGRWSTLQDFKNLGGHPRSFGHTHHDLVKRSPMKLLPLLIHHENDYIRWAVKTRLSLKRNFSTIEYQESK